MDCFEKLIVELATLKKYSHNSLLNYLDSYNHYLWLGLNNWNAFKRVTDEMEQENIKNNS